LLAILSVEAPGWQGAKAQPGGMHRCLKCKVIFERALKLILTMLAGYENLPINGKKYGFYEFFVMLLFFLNF